MMASLLCGSAPPPTCVPGLYKPFFVQGLASYPPRLVFSTGIHLLTTHAFTGEYSTRFRSHSNDPPHCPCGDSPGLRTT